MVFARWLLWKPDEEGRALYSSHTFMSASHSLVFQCPPIAWHVLEEEGEVEMHSLSANVYKHHARRATADMIALYRLWESWLIIRPAMV